MSSSKWKSSYDKGRKHNDNREKTFLWLKMASDSLEDAYCKLWHTTIMPRHSNLMNHEKNEKHQKRVPPTGQTAFKVVNTSSTRSDALKVAEFQIAVSTTCRSAVRSADHPGEIMVTHEKGSNFMSFNNFFPGLAFFSKGVCSAVARQPRTPGRGAPNIRRGTTIYIVLVS